MSQELDNKIKEVIELAKAEFGERVIVGKTYTSGNIYDGYDEEYHPLDKLMDLNEFTDNDIERIKNLDEDGSYVCDDIYTIVKCAAEVSNPGWRFELLRIIREWDETA